MASATVRVSQETLQVLRELAEQLGESMPKILAFAGSLRADSFNKTLVNIAAKGARQAGAGVTVISLSDYPMPVLNQDDEAANGKPEAAKQLKALMIEHDGFLIACPEYNSSISSALKKYGVIGENQRVLSRNVFKTVSVCVKIGGNC